MKKIINIVFPHTIDINYKGFKVALYVSAVVYI